MEGYNAMANAALEMVKSALSEDDRRLLEKALESLVAEAKAKVWREVMAGK